MHRILTLSTTRGRRVLGVLSLALLVAVIAGCGSSSDNTNTSSSTAGAAGATTTAASGSSGIVADADKQLNVLYDGTFTLPTEKSPTPVKGKNIWAISIGQTSTSIASVLKVFKDVSASKLGWKVTVFDGKFQPNLWQTGIRQAIAAKADAIWVVNIDCQPVLAALEDAKRAKIPVIINEGYGCPAGKEDLLSYLATYNTTIKNGVVGKGEGSFAELNQAWGAAGAWQLIKATGGKAKIINLVETDNGSTLEISKGAHQVYDLCKTCKVLEDIKFVGGDIGPGLQSKVKQALTQHPDANAVHGNYDDILTTGVASAVSAAGGDIPIVGVEGNAAVMQLAREGKALGGSGFFGPWEGYCGIDEFIYVFAGQKPRPCGLGASAWNKDHHLAPAGQGFDPEMPYQAAYLKSWGL
jgi:ribose transport system substrate-binding protein